MKRALWLLVLPALLPSARAHGQAFELNRFRPAPLVSDGFAVNGTDVPGHLGLDLKVTIDYAHQPLVVDLATRQEYAVVNHQLALHVGAALGLGKRGLIYGIVPVNAMMRGNDPPSGILTRLPRPERGGLGDARLGARVRLLGDAHTRAALAAQVALALPLASVNGGQLYSGDDMLQVEPQVMLDLHLSKTTLRFNVGARFREDEPLLDSRVGDELTFAFGAQYAFTRRFRAVADLYGASGFKHFGRGTETPLEALFGGKYQHAQGMNLALAVGPGLVHGVGTPDVRALLTLGWATPKHEPPEREAPPPAPADGDGDGVPDANDACPTEPEDLDGDRDLDGCPEEPEPPAPEPDTDGDGVLDQDDACPSEQGTPATNGCPEPVVQKQDTTLHVLGRVHFASNDARAEPGSVAILKAVRKALEEDPSITVLLVEGHTDANGDATFNLNLSKRRARTIAQWLRQQGVPMDRVEVVACGEDRPAGAHPDPKGRRDRRVELKAEPSRSGECVPAQ